MGDIRLGENMRAGNSARIGAMRIGGSRVGAAFVDLKTGLSADTALSIFPIQTWDFDGTARLDRAAIWSGTFNSKLYTLSLWFKSDAASASVQYFLSATTPTTLLARMDADGKLYVEWLDSVAGSLIILQSATAYENDNTWHHLLASVDAGTDSKFLYVDGVSDLSGAPTANDRTANMESSAVLDVAASAGANTFEGQLGQIYMASGYKVDPSVAAELALFYSAAGGPVDLGSDGSTPSGSQPVLFMRDNEDLILNNRGFGGSWATETGTVVDNGVHPTRTEPTDGNQYYWQQQHMGGVKRLDDTLNDTQWTSTVGAPT